jgi:hypothetical protein
MLLLGWRSATPGGFRAICTEAYQPWIVLTRTAYRSDMPLPGIVGRIWLD